MEKKKIKDQVIAMLVALLGWLGVTVSGVQQADLDAATARAENAEAEAVKAKDQMEDAQLAAEMAEAENKCLQEAMETAAAGAAIDVKTKAAILAAAEEIIKKTEGLAQ